MSGSTPHCASPGGASSPARYKGATCMRFLHFHTHNCYNLKHPCCTVRASCHPLTSFALALPAVDPPCSIPPLNCPYPRLNEPSQLMAVPPLYDHPPSAAAVSCTHQSRESRCALPSRLPSAQHWCPCRPQTDMVFGCLYMVFGCLSYHTFSSASLCSMTSLLTATMHGRDTFYYVAATC